MASRKETILQFLAENEAAFTAAEIAEQLDLDRANASRYLNELYKSGEINKINGRPVRYQKLIVMESIIEEEAFSKLIGSDASLKMMIQQAKAAILYPPNGLHTMILGKTGTGKSLFAECMYKFAVESNTLNDEAPFISFNCADYAQNPQLLYGHIFGVKKGSFTGATEDRDGLLKKANGGILFLDEIHRLPPEGQEALFTFIDKGEFRPLGESGTVTQVSVQIIGATTEGTESLLSTFKRRIPMTITLPPLSERTIEERYDLVTTFLQQEAYRLGQKIVVEREVLSAFMLYQPEGNIGQIQRDLKLVCAKAFLHYRTQNHDHLQISQKDLPLQVQKGLLFIKEAPESMERLIDMKKSNFSFLPASQERILSETDPAADMRVYTAIDQKVNEISQGEVPDNIELETLLQSDMEEYFREYVEKLSMTDIHQEIIPQEISRLTDKLYDVIEERLSRKYDGKARFAFALHLQSMIERVKEHRNIVHPDLNDVRKRYSKEFQVAIELSGIIEEEFNIELPFDEIGFITMFLTIELGETPNQKEHMVEVFVLMHGNSTATSMLETAQELLDMKYGYALNMPLTMEVQKMYEQLRKLVLENQAQYTSGILLLTDMGSLTSFGNMIYEETGIRTKALSMVSTPIVLEAVRMASIGRSLEDIYQTCQSNFENMTRQMIQTDDKKPQAILVTCFTGEGVAAHIYNRIKLNINENKVKIIQLQFLHREAFKKKIDDLMEEYEIKAIVGTVEFNYQNIPFFSAYDIFENEKLNLLRRIVDEEVPVEQIVSSLEGQLVHVGSVQKLILLLQKMVHEIQSQMQTILEPGVDIGIILHLAFLVERLKTGNFDRHFPEREAYQKQHRLEMDIVKTAMLKLEKEYRIHIPTDEIAFVVQMLVNNQMN
ncbi:sigma 54-interacting transcriptional regulator [Isobaculum melis]|uniref:DNA translocase FtsK n=1 Tax=Isobaculum melis TaxID=142588 RepID=A0A1H9TYP2_9LACT|nr:sigma-54-dependent transcriptional regulator [Isobaculum melis]SES02131.1 Transcriptional regulatory protein LevR, contains PRD, AAA+ and EIIA domains [Isobaculum melis]